MHKYLYGPNWRFPNPISFENAGIKWNSGEPNDVCAVEDCGEVTHDGRLTVLNAVACSLTASIHESGFICKKPKCTRTLEEKHECPTEKRRIKRSSRFHHSGSLTFAKKLVL